MAGMKSAAASLFALALLANVALAQWHGFTPVHRQVPDFASDNGFPIVLLDVEGDGDLDVAAAGVGDGWALARNDGDAQFADVSDALPPNSTYSSATSLDAGDVDGDGDPDLLIGVIGAFSGLPNRLFLDDGSGRFTDETSRLPSFAGLTTAVRLGDLDNDGDLDAAITAPTSIFFPGESVIYRNDGQGYFSVVSQSLDSGQAEDLDLGDVDGDGDLDVLVAQGRYCDPYGYGCWDRENALYLNRGDATFDRSGLLPHNADDTNTVRFADLDGDHDLDIVVGNVDAQNRLYLNDGYGGFTDVSDRLPARIDPTSCLQSCDVDGDGDLDLMVGTSSALHLLINDGSAHFVEIESISTPPQPASSLAPADLDGDGDQDVLATLGGALNLFLGRGDRRLRDPGGNRDLPGSCKLGDIDGDGDLDAILEGSRTFVSLNDGAGDLAPRDQPGTTSSPEVAEPPTGSVALGDIDGDGDLDVFDGGDGKHAHRFFINDGSGEFAPDSARLPPHVEAQKGFFSDLDGDGDLDLLAAVPNAAIPNRLYRNDGSGHFADASASLPPRTGESNDVAFGDLDGDGDVDVIIGNTQYGYFGAPSSLFLNDGTGVFTDASGQLPSGSHPTLAVALGDIDRDGDLDVVLGNWSGIGAEMNQLFLNDGTGTFTDATSRIPFPPYEQTLYCVALLDFDEDGDLDLLCGNAGADTYYLNDGAGYFSAAPQLAPRITQRPALGDIDGDGDIDVVGSTSSVNLLRQLAWRGLPRIGHSLTLDLTGLPNGSWMLLGAARPAHLVTPFGTLLLDPSSLVIAAQGSLDDQGRRSLVAAIAKDPVLVGLSVYAQALVGAPLRFTNLEVIPITDY